MPLPCSSNNMHSVWHRWQSILNARICRVSAHLSKCDHISRVAFLFLSLSVCGEPHFLWFKNHFPLFAAGRRPSPRTSEVDEALSLFGCWRMCLCLVFIYLFHLCLAVEVISVRVFSARRSSVCSVLEAVSVSCSVSSQVRINWRKQFNATQPQHSRRDNAGLSASGLYRPWFVSSLFCFPSFS